MFRTTLLSFLVAISCYATVSAQGSKIDSSKAITLRIDPDASRGAAVSQVFEEVEFIPLETTKESLFGSIQALGTTSDRYIIYDWDTRSILIFTKEGKYKAKISGSKMEKDPNPGKNESKDLYGFELIKENNKDVIQVYLGKYYFYYDTDGKLLRRVASKDLPYGNEIKFTNGSVLSRYYIDSSTKDSTRYEVALLTNGKANHTFFGFNKDRYNGDEFFSAGDNLTNSGNPDEYFYETYYNPSIFKITPNGVSLAYRIIFPAAMSLPADFLTNPDYKGKRQQFFEANKEVVYGIGNVFQIGDNLIFKTSSWNWGKEKKNALMQNVKSGALTSLTNLEPDTLSQFLPVTDAGHFYDFLNRGFHKYDGSHFYTSYSSLAMFSFKELNEGKSRKYDPILENYFKTSDKKSNPILIKLKPKKD